MMQQEFGCTFGGKKKSSLIHDIGPDEAVAALTEHQHCLL